MLAITRKEGQSFLLIKGDEKFDVTFDRSRMYFDNDGMQWRYTLSVIDRATNESKSYGCFIGERFFIEPMNTVVMLVKYHMSELKIGVDAPASVIIIRSEIYENKD